MALCFPLCDAAGSGGLFSLNLGSASKREVVFGSLRRLWLQLQSLHDWDKTVSIAFFVLFCFQWADVKPLAPGGWQPLRRPFKPPPAVGALARSLPEHGPTLVICF